MPPYQFQQYEPRYAGTIIDLLQRPAQARAKALRDIGLLQAQGAQQQGQITAQAVQSIGDTIGRGVQGYADYRQQAPQRELQQLQLEGARRAQADVSALDQAFANGADRESILNALPGHLRPTVMKQFQEADDAAFKVKKLKTDAEEAEADYFGALASGVKAHGYDLFAAGSALQHAMSAGYEEQAQQIFQQIKSNPDALPQVVDALIAKSPKYAALAGTAAGREETARHNAATEGQAATNAAETARHNAFTEAPVPAYAASPDRQTLTPVGTVPANAKILPALQPRDPLAQELAAGRLADQKARAGRAAEFSAIPTQYRSAFEAAVALAPNVRREDAEQEVARLWKEGNTEELSRRIKQYALQNENVDTRNQVRGRMQTIRALESAKKLLTEMQQAGVPFNWATGTMEELARKIGTSTDARFARFKNRIKDAQISYRRAATGVQFSVIESQEYDQMFPGYKNTMSVNTALIDGLLDSMRQNDRVYWEERLGPAGADLIGVSAGTAAPPPPSSGGTGARVYYDENGNPIKK